ncbi:MAG: hypothetical protein NVSMB9_09960 [Isosphaeraceae bacterium]
MSISRKFLVETGAPLGGGGAERRHVCRYSVVQDEAWLGWWEGQVFQSTPARIIDISLRGAMLTVETFPPKNLPLWFCPPGVSDQDEWIEAQLVQMKKKIFGPREVRLSFRKIFPYEIFKAVVYGPDVYRPSDLPTYVPEESEERDWW